MSRDDKISVKVFVLGLISILILSLNSWAACHNCLVGSAEFAIRMLQTHATQDYGTTQRQCSNSDKVLCENLEIDEILNRCIETAQTLKADLRVDDSYDCGNQVNLSFDKVYSLEIKDSLVYIHQDILLETSEIVGHEDLDEFQSYMQNVFEDITNFYRRFKIVYSYSLDIEKKSDKDYHFEIEVKPGIGQTTSHRFYLEGLAPGDKQGYKGEFFASTMAHEMLHTMGLLDMYINNRSSCEKYYWSNEENRNRVRNNESYQIDGKHYWNIMSIAGAPLDDLTLASFDFYELIRPLCPNVCETYYY